MKILSIVFGLFLTVSVFAQTEEAAPANWFTDLAKAQEFAAEHDQKILMVFAGSDWCKPCIQFKKDILSSLDFTEFAAEKLAVLYLDFPSRRKNRLSKEQTAHNEALAGKYNKQGIFPKIVLTDDEGNILVQPEFKSQTPEKFIAEISR